MHPESTKYRLMQRHDVKRCLDLARSYGFETVARLGFPTVVAKRKGKILGFLSTRPSTEAIIAGPLVVGPEVKGPITLRLVEAYENVLRSLGVEHYLFYVDDPHWQKQVKRAFGLDPYHMKDGTAWYRRHLDGRRKLTTDSPTVGG